MTTKAPNFTKGPWFFRVNESSKSVQLVGAGSNIVMAFFRYGMQRAAPAFNVKGILRRCDQLAVPIKGQEHNADHLKMIDHPDAHLILASPKMYEALEAINKWHDQYRQLPPSLSGIVKAAIDAAHGEIKQ